MFMRRYGHRKPEGAHVSPCRGRLESDRRGGQADPSHVPVPSELGHPEGHQCSGGGGPQADTNDPPGDCWVNIFEFQNRTKRRVKVRQRLCQTLVRWKLVWNLSPSPSVTASLP